MQSTEILQRWNPRPEGDLVNSTPFLLRGHHLAILRQIATGEEVPDEKAQKIVETIMLGQRSDAIDVIGITAEERDFFRDTSAKFFERFRDLPEDFPVKIVAGKEDGICSGCAVGNHCARDVYRDADIKYISQFISRAGALVIEEEDQEGLKLSYDDNGKPILTTTIGMVRKVLKNWRVHNMNTLEGQL